MLGGELFFHFINVMLMTAVVAQLILWRYRRAVLAGMRDRGGAALPFAPAPIARSSDAPWRDTPPEKALTWEAHVRRRVFVAVLAALALPSLLLAAHYLYLDQEPITPARLWLSAGATLIMAVPIFALLTSTPFWRALRMGIVTLCAFAAVLVLLSALQRIGAGKAPTPDQAINFLIFFQYAALALWLPMLLGLALGARRIRGVAPLAFAGLLVFAFAPLLGIRLTTWLTGNSWGTDWVLTGPGIDAGFVVLALPVGLLAWWRLKRVARAYEAKRFSDAQLLARSLWLMLVATRIAELVSVYPGTTALLHIVAVCAVAYLLFPVLLAPALRWAYAGTTRPPPRTLLLLRVFGDTRRTEALFDRIGSRWQLFGPVTMIAAPDVVARTVDPGDVLGFALGNIGASFVKSQDELSRRLAALDRAPDRDGRYRVTEFCCRDDTWQATVVELIARADAVVMDLRGFTALRHGCEFELRELAARLSPGRVVLVVDASTDRALLEQVAPAGQRQMRIMEVKRGSGRQTDAAFAALLRAAS